MCLHARVPDCIRNEKICACALGLNTDNSQLIINALLILSKGLVTLIVRGEFTHKCTPRTKHTQHKATQRRKLNVSHGAGTDRTLHRAKVTKEAKLRLNQKSTWKMGNYTDANGDTSTQQPSGRSTFPAPSLAPPHGSSRAPPPQHAGCPSPRGSLARSSPRACSRWCAAVGVSGH